MATSKKTPLRKIGEPARVELKRFGRTLVIEGRVKDVRRSYGHFEYFIVDAMIYEDGNPGLWSRNVQ